MITQTLWLETWIGLGQWIFHFPYCIVFQPNNVQHDFMVPGQLVKKFIPCSDAETFSVGKNNFLYFFASMSGIVLKLSLLVYLCAVSSIFTHAACALYYPAHCWMLYQHTKLSCLTKQQNTFSFFFLFCFCFCPTSETREKSESNSLFGISKLGQ